LDYPSNKRDSGIKQELINIFRYRAKSLSFVFNRKMSQNNNNILDFAQKNLYCVKKIFLN